MVMHICKSKEELARHLKMYGKAYGTIWTTLDGDKTFRSPLQGKDCLYWATTKEDETPVNHRHHRADTGVLEGYHRTKVRYQEQQLRFDLCGMDCYIDKEKMQVDVHDMSFHSSEDWPAWETENFESTLVRGREYYLIGYFVLQPDGTVLATTKALWGLIIRETEKPEFRQAASGTASTVKNMKNHKFWFVLFFVAFVIFFIYMASRPL